MGLNFGLWYSILICGIEFWSMGLFVLTGGNLNFQVWLNYEGGKLRAKPAAPIEEFQLNFSGNFLK